MSEIKLDEYFLCIFIDKLVFKYDKNRTKYLIERYKHKLVNKPTIEQRNKIILEEICKEINDSILKSKKDEADQLVFNKEIEKNLTNKYIYYLSNTPKY